MSWLLQTPSKQIEFATCPGDILPVIKSTTHLVSINDWWMNGLRKTGLMGATLFNNGCTTPTGTDPPYILMDAWTHLGTQTP